VAEELNAAAERKKLKATEQAFFSFCVAKDS
jgi:hypothetical protein